MSEVLTILKLKLTLIPLFYSLLVAVQEFLNSFIFVLLIQVVLLIKE